MDRTKDVIIHEYERVDDLQYKGLKLIQNPESFCFGIDAVLLANYAKASKGDTVVDLGTGTGVIPILMSGKTEADRLIGFDIQDESVEMAARSVALNSLSDRVEIRKGDICELPDSFPKGSVDVVTSNPPYMIDSHGLHGDTDAKTIARHEVKCTLDDVAKAASSMLKTGGYFYMIHRPFRLAEIMVTLVSYHLEPKRMRFVYPYIDKEPTMVLIEARRDGKSRVTVEKPLIVYDSPGVYTEDILEYYGTN